MATISRRCCGRWTASTCRQVQPDGHPRGAALASSGNASSSEGTISTCHPRRATVETTCEGSRNRMSRTSDWKASGTVGEERTSSGVVPEGGTTGTTPRASQKIPNAANVMARSSSGSQQDVGPGTCPRSGSGIVVRHVRAVRESARAPVICRFAASTWAAPSIAPVWRVYGVLRSPFYYSWPVRPLAVTPARQERRPEPGEVTTGTTTRVKEDK